jgi:hypothetical protein
MHNFKEDDTVFIPSIKKFATVYRHPDVLGPNTEEIVRVKISKEGYGYLAYHAQAVILVEPDTPENRLLIQLKHG